MHLNEIFFIKRNSNKRYSLKHENLNEAAILKNLN